MGRLAATVAGRSHLVLAIVWLNGRAGVRLDVFGPLMIVPVYLIGTIAGTLSQPLGYRWPAIVFPPVLAFVVPLGLELVGIMPSSFHIDHGLVLNQIGSVTLSTARPLIFDRYLDNRGTGSFILIDPATNFTSGAGMIAEAIRERSGAAAARPSAAERLARVARSAANDAEATEAVRKALEELLS